MSSEPGDVLVRALTAHGGKACAHEEYTGKLVETEIHYRGKRATSAQALYVKGGHYVYVHGFKDSDDVLVSFLASKRAAILRINGWMLCLCMVECGYMLDESVREAVQDERDDEISTTSRRYAAQT